MTTPIPRPIPHSYTSASPTSDILHRYISASGVAMDHSTSSSAALQGMTAAIKRYTHDETITIILDDCPEKFTVSKALLCSTSDYFTKALDGKFSEATSRTLKLPGCDLATFELFVFFITTNRFPDFVAADKIIVPAKSGRKDIQARLVRAWVFGDYLGLSSFQNQAMNSLLDYLGTATILVSTVEMIFKTASEESVLRDVAVLECVCGHIFESHYSPASMRRLAKLPDFLLEFTGMLQDHYEGEMESDDYPHTDEDRSEYMAAQSGSAANSRE